MRGRFMCYVALGCVGKAKSLAKGEGCGNSLDMTLRPKMERLIPKLAAAISAIEK